MSFIKRLLKKWIQKNVEIEITKASSSGLKTESKHEKVKNTRAINGSEITKKTSYCGDNNGISFSLLNNENRIKLMFEKCDDFIIREINITNDPKIAARVMYLANMIPKSMLEESVVQRLTDPPAENSPFPGSIEYTQGILGIGNSDTHETIDKARDAILEGNAVIFIQGIANVLVTGVKEPPGRPVEESSAEKVVRGPREGFVELIPVNLALMRRKIKSVDLKIEMIKVGRQTRTDIAICYMANIADSKIVEEVRRRIDKIDIDSVLDSNYIAEYIQDHRINLLPTIFRTEKPDVVAGKILEGRIAVIVDGTPIALTVPTVFSEFMSTSEDYYQNYFLASALRVIRYTAFYLSLTLPGIYVSLITFHSELLPSRLAVTVVKSRANVPFNAFVEAFLMILTFTILQEADIRIPKTMGQAVSVVGALVLGEAAVSAGLVSPAMVIVAAFSGISGLAVPAPEMQLSLIYLRFAILLAGGIFGLFGVTCALLSLFMYFVSQRSFGVPYLTPVSPIDAEDLRDVFIRAPLWKMTRRPEFINWKGGTRRKGKQGHKQK